jgi:hypothetical protein
MTATAGHEPASVEGTAESLLRDLISVLAGAMRDAQRDSAARRAGKAPVPSRPGRAAQAAPEPPPVAVLAGRRGCGTFLAFLLHRALGERPCRSCVHAAAARWAEQAARDYRRDSPRRAS